MIRMQLGLGHSFFLYIYISVTELRNIKSFSTYSSATSLYATLPQTCLQICLRVQDGYDLLSTTSQALSVQVRMLVRFSH